MLINWSKNSISSKQESEEFRKKHIWDSTIAILQEIANMKGYELSIDINNGWDLIRIWILQSYLYSLILSGYFYFKVFPHHFFMV